MIYRYVETIIMNIVFYKFFCGVSSGIPNLLWGAGNMPGRVTA